MIILEFIIEQIDYSNSSYVKDAVIRFMLHVSHTMWEESPITLFQVITENVGIEEAPTIVIACEGGSFQQALRWEGYQKNDWTQRCCDVEDAYCNDNE